MNCGLLFILLGACAVLMILERRGLKTTLALNFKGDIKRESRWLAQYGQALCTAIAAVLVWQLDVRRREKAVIPVVMERGGGDGNCDDHQAAGVAGSAGGGRTPGSFWGLRGHMRIIGRAFHQVIAHRRWRFRGCWQSFIRRRHPLSGHWRWRVRGCDT